MGVMYCNAQTRDGLYCCYSPNRVIVSVGNAVEDRAVRLEESELLLGGTEDLVLLDLENVESHGLGQGSALTRSHDISFLNIEARGAVHGGVLVTLLETIVLLDVVQVVATDDDSSSHLSGHNHTSEDSTTDRNISSEGALLVDVGSVDGFLGCGETKTNVLPPTLGLLGSDTHGGSILLLESSLCLVSHVN